MSTATWSWWASREIRLKLGAKLMTKASRALYTPDNGHCRDDVGDGRNRPSERGDSALKPSKFRKKPWKTAKTRTSSPLVRKLRYA
jgi:hypothetical protein